MPPETSINQEVLVILLKRIIELLDTKEEPIESVSVDNLDVVSASLRNELAKVVKAVKDSQPDNTDVLKELKKLTDAINAIELKPTINVAGADVTIPDFNIPTPQVTVNPPDIHIPAPVVNLPATDLTDIIKALEINLNKVRTNSETRPVAVRISDGQKWNNNISKSVKSSKVVCTTYSSESMNDLIILINSHLQTSDKMFINAIFIEEDIFYGVIIEHN